MYYLIISTLAGIQRTTLGTPEDLSPLSVIFLLRIGDTHLLLQRKLQLWGGLRAKELWRALKGMLLPCFEKHACAAAMNSWVQPLFMPPATTTIGGPGGNSLFPSASQLASLAWHSIGMLTRRQPGGRKKPSFFLAPAIQTELEAKELGIAKWQQWEVPADPHCPRGQPGMGTDSCMVCALGMCPTWPPYSPTMLHHNLLLSILSVLEAFSP